MVGIAVAVEVVAVVAVEAVVVVGVEVEVEVGVRVVGGRVTPFAVGKSKRYAAKRDANEAEIVEALEQAYCDVVRLDWPVDLLVGRAGVSYLIEVKQPGTKRKDQPEQDRFLEQWRGHVARVETPEQALEAVGVRVK